MPAPAAAPATAGNAIATHCVTLADGDGRGWQVQLEMPRGRLADATRTLRGGMATPSRNGLPGRLRIAAKLAAAGQDPAAYLRDGETVTAVKGVVSAASPLGAAVTFTRTAGRTGFDVRLNGRSVGFLVGVNEVRLHLYDDAAGGVPVAVACLAERHRRYKSRMSLAKAVVAALLARLSPADLLARLRAPGAMDALALARRLDFDPEAGRVPATGTA